MLWAVIIPTSTASFKVGTVTTVGFSASVSSSTSTSIVSALFLVALTERTAVKAAVVGAAHAGRERVFAAVDVGCSEDTDVTNYAQPSQDLLRRRQPPSIKATEATGADTAAKIAHKDTAA